MYSIKGFALDYQVKFVRRNGRKAALAPLAEKEGSAKHAPPSRFLAPITDIAVQDAARCCVPKATEKATNWTLNLWKEWQNNRKDNGADYPLTPPHLLTEKLLNEWMCKFILEVRRKDGAEYPPNSLYQIVCGILRHVRIYAPSINFFTQPQYDTFRRVLDGEMKRLKSKGFGVVVKRAEPIDIKEEEMLWSSGILDDSEPQSLLDTIIFMCGYYLALRSGQEHRDLQFSQLEIIEREGGKVLRYTENVSKNNPGGLKHCKIEPKIIEHCANTMNPERCFIRYYEKYVSHCPPISERKSNSFYLTPLKKPKNDVWYSTVPVGTVYYLTYK